jgi:hypothetical protein
MRVITAGDEMEDQGPPRDMTTGGEPYEVCEVSPDMDLLANEVGPSIIEGCGGRACHGSTANITRFNLPSGLDDAPAPLSDDQANAMLEMLTPFVDFEEPSTSELLTLLGPGHQGTNLTFGEGAPSYEALERWIVEATVCEWVYPDPPEGGSMAGTMVGSGGVEAGAEMGGVPSMGGAPSDTELFCAALPTGDPQGRPGFYETFRDNINGILSNSCALSGCHDLPYAEYGFWVINEREACSVQANFMMSQLYVNYNTPLSSPILTKPLDPEHGGYRILNAADPEYTAIRAWIVSGVQD